MPKKVKADPEKMFLPERIDLKIKKIENYPLVSIESPMGYGKTMCMRTFLKKNEYMYIWQSVMDSSQHYFWEQFCNLFAQIDKDIARELETIGFPTDSILACTAINLIGTSALDQDIFFIIDDYQLMFSQELNRFFYLLARENIEHLHFILIGRNSFNDNREELQLKNHLLVINENDLKLTEEECLQYFNYCGIKITSAQNKSLYAHTEGWISALYIIMATYAESGELFMPENIFDLFEKAIYSNYTDDQKDFLMRVCVFNYFSKEQARFVRRRDDPLQILEELVASNGFIRYDGKAKKYHIHSMYAEFLRNKLSHRELRYRNEVCRHAADWHYLNNEFFLATLYYYKSLNYEDMLKAFEKDRGKSLSGKSRRIMIEAFNACPEKIKNKYPMASMIYAKQLSMMNEREKLKEVILELGKYLKSERMSEREKTAFKGEYYMLLSFLSYNNLNKMTIFHRKAAKFLKTASAIEDSQGCWTYGSPSVMYMFYRQSGTLDSLVKELYDSRDLYYKLTNNNGRGCEYILDSEKEFCRGRFDKAEILAFKALNVAQKYKQTGIMVCALFMQSRILILKGETEKGIDVLNNIRELVVDNDKYVFIHTADMCKAFIYSLFNQLKPIEHWILDGDFENVGMYHPAFNYIYIIYGRILINRGEYSRYLGYEETFFKGAREFPNLLTELYLDIYSAISYRKMGMRDEAIVCIKNAVSAAYEDEIFIPFVENGRHLHDFFEVNDLTGREQAFIDKCRFLYKKYEKNLNVLLKEDDQSPINMLTKREQEISMLVAEGKTNMEIAKQLNVAEITIKKSLSNIYARLGINNRASLSKKISV